MFNILNTRAIEKEFDGEVRVEYYHYLYIFLKIDKRYKNIYIHGSTQIILERLFLTTSEVLNSFPLIAAP